MPPGIGGQQRTSSARVCWVSHHLRNTDRGEAGWIAVRQVVAGLLPRCAAADAMEEQARGKVEAEVALAIVEAQQVVLNMTRRYKTDTRRNRAQKQELIEVWWHEHVRERDRLRGLRARVVTGLRRQGQGARLRRKRLREAVEDAIGRAEVERAEAKRRATARNGGGCAETRMCGVHRVGRLDEDRERRRKPEFGWEAGDSKRPRRVGPGSSAAPPAHRLGGGGAGDGAGRVGGAIGSCTVWWRAGSS